MARVVDYLKKLLKNNRVINDNLIAISLYESIIKNEKLNSDFDNGIDLNNEQVCKVLGEITELKIEGIFTREALRQLKLVLRYMTCLKRLSIINITDDERIDITSVLDSLNMDIEEILLSGVDISKGISEDSSKKFEKLKFFSIENSNIPEIPVFPKEGCIVSLGERIDKISANGIGENIINREIKNILATDNEKINEMIGAVSGKALPSFYYENGDICINDVSELSLEKLQILKKNDLIKYISIKVEQYKSEYKEAWYSIDEYTAIREEINKIVSEVELPEDNDPDREKKIFAQVYKLLGERISYDYYAISEEGKKDNKLMFDCRNLKNGLLGTERDGKKQYLAVCAGYANILRNVLACFGIESKYIGSSSELQYEIKNGKEVPKTDVEGKRLYKNGTNDPMGHAYNLVILDGQKYYCDLTWDADNIKADRYPLKNFLVSYEEFLVSHEEQGFSEDLADKEANVSLSYEEQLTLFGQVMKAKDKVEEMIQENYLSGFVSEFLSSIQQCREKVGIIEFFKMMVVMKRVEELILQKENARDENVIMNFINGERYTFETSDDETYKNLKKQIEERRMRESGHESR